MEIVPNETYQDAEEEYKALLAANQELKDIVKHLYGHNLVNRDGDNIFQLKLPFAVRIEQALQMHVVRYYAISQFAHQPTTIEDLSALIQVGDAREVDKMFAPSWGGGLYKLEDGKIEMTTHNWDSSD